MWVIANAELITDKTVTTGDPFVVYNVGWGALYCNLYNGGTGVSHTFTLEKQTASDNELVYNKVVINDTTYIDLSRDTVSSANHIR